MHREWLPVQLQEGVGRHIAKDLKDGHIGFT